MADVTRVLFVCLGNICRSPMAHGVFQHAVGVRGLSDRFEVDSAGTAAYHVGNRPDPRTLAVLEGAGIELVHRARQATATDALHFDYLLAMDRSNRDALQRLAPRSADKIHLMLDPIGGGDVADPYYGGPDGFAVNFAQIERATAAWIDRMMAGW